MAQGLASEEVLLAALSAQVGIPGISLERLLLSLRFLKVLPLSLANKYCILPVRVGQGQIFLATRDPSLGDLRDELAFRSKRRIVLCVALASLLEDMLTAAYSAKTKGELELRGRRAENNLSEPLPFVVDAGVADVPSSVLDDSAEDPASSAVEIEFEASPPPPVAHDGVLTAEPPTAEAAELLGRPQVLVVDDDVDLARLVQRLLQGVGLTVNVAHRGLEALTRVREDPPDLLILDAMLPEVHGFDIARKLKESERYRQIPIIMVSSVYRGWRIAQDLRESYQVEEFLEKPVDFEILLRTVQRALDRKTNRRRVISSAVRAYRRGLRRYQANDLDGAITYFKEGISIDPLAAKLHHQLGVLYLKKRGMVYQAIEAFEAAVQLDPRFFSALRSLAVLYQRKGFLNKAIEMWERAVRCSPDERTAHKLREHLMTLLSS
ncbi:MAG: response regulator [Deltaproteobacteria bacterium]|nr:response regulator [Deltaproteobacteria bacterium]